VSVAVWQLTAHNRGRYARSVGLPHWQQREFGKPRRIGDMSQEQRAKEAPPGIAATIIFGDPSVVASLNRTSGELTWFGSDGQAAESADDDVLFLGTAGTVDEALIADRVVDSSVELELPHLDLDSAEAISLRIVFLVDDPWSS
jgi:hypothetical protein